VDVVEQGHSGVGTVGPEPAAHSWDRKAATALMVIALLSLTASAVILRARSDRDPLVVEAGDPTMDDVGAAPAEAPVTAATTTTAPTPEITAVLVPVTSAPGPVYADPPTCSLLGPPGSNGADATCPRGKALQLEVDWYACLTANGLPSGTVSPSSVAVAPTVAIAATTACANLRPPMATKIIGPYGECMRQQGQFFIPGAVVEGFAEAREGCRSQLPPPPFPPETLAYHDCLREAGYDVNGPLPGDPAPSGPPTLNAPRAAGEACRHLMVGLDGMAPDDYTNCLADQGIFVMIPGPRWMGPSTMAADQACRR